ncbi:MAG: topoisomerase DNA-binding C4 zinc finger domain-containing protein, partial [Rhodanobacteraceae bacterium]
RFVEGKPIELIHGEALLAMVRNAQTASPPVRDVPSVVAQSHPAVPDCPKCGTPMIKRNNRRTRDVFWGCPKYPSCRGTRPA